MADIRVLIATTSFARDGLARSLAGCPVDFVCSFDEGIEILQRVSYTHVIVGYFFAESDMFDFALQVRQYQPSARVLCVKAAGRPLREKMRDGLNIAALQIGCEGFFDLSAGGRADTFDRVFDDILRCFYVAPAATRGQKGTAVAAKLNATAQELRRLAMR